jgi:hypothetical protein
MNEMRNMITTTLLLPLALSGLSLTQTAASIQNRPAANHTVGYEADDVFTAFDLFQYNTPGQRATGSLQGYDLPDNISNSTCFSSPSSFSWNISSGTAVGNANSSLFQPVLVGDLDSDGFVELVVPKERISNSWTAGYPTNGINIHDMKTGQMHTIATAEFATIDLGPTGIAKAHASHQEALIVVSSTDGFLYAYNKSGSQKWKSDSAYTNLPAPSGYTYLAGAVGFADFNGDGYAEIYIKDKIFDLETGMLLLSVQDEISTVFDLGSTVADLNGDGKLELIIRGKVYQINLTNRTGTAHNSASLWREVINNPYPQAGKATLMADFDLDGKLDILVNDEEWFYIWDPYTGNVKINQTKGGNYKGNGLPSIGDIDNDGYPEIIYTGIRSVMAWDIDGKPTATKKWRLTMSNGSGYAGVSLFDFNQDGRVELVYHDETLLSILNGSSSTGSQYLASAACISGSQREYPVIADIDDDGRAEIIITGGNSSTSVPHTGHIRIFNASAGNQWAPCRKVWNQYAFNGAFVNNDLSIPKAPVHLSVALPGQDGLPGTADDRRPYNAFLQQQTIINKNGNPLWLLPDVNIVGQPQFYYYTPGDLLQVKVTITNVGQPRLSAPFSVSAYQNTVMAGKMIATKSYDASIAMGDTLSIILPIAKFSTFRSLNNLIIRINDKGNARYDQPECDYAGNASSRLKETVMIANNDYEVHMDPSEKIPVLRNDLIPAGCRSTLKMDTVAGQPPKNGVMTINADSTFSYKPAQNFFGIDSITYYLKCGADSSVARVYIIISKPLAKTYSACKGATMSIGFAPTQGLRYNWYNTANGYAPFTAGNTISVVKDDYARQSWWVEPIYNGTTFARHRIDATLSENCGQTVSAGCMLTGTLLFKEDFGGNAVVFPHDKGGGIPQVSGYIYRSTLSGNGVYAISKTSSRFIHSVWYKKIFDHTYAGDDKKGYFIAFDASDAPGQFYRHEIDNLCAGTRLYFSAWLTSLLSHNKARDRANLIFLVEDPFGNVLAQFCTGNIPDMDPEWKSYGFEFTLPEGISSLVLKIVNNGTGSDGNDFVMDDIEIRICSPEIEINTPSKRDTSVCERSPIHIQAHYTDDGSFGKHLACHWEFSVSGDVEDPNDWAILPGTIKHSDNGKIASTYTIPAVGNSHAGHYRLAIASSPNIDAPRCRTASRIIQLKVVPIPAASSIQTTPPSCDGEALTFRIPPTAEACEWRHNDGAGSLAGTATYVLKKTPGTHTLVVRTKDLSDCWSDYSAPASGEVRPAAFPASVKVTAIRSDYSATKPVVTFSVAWPDQSRNCRHNASVWVFVDHRLPAGNNQVRWERATLGGTPTLTSTDPASSITLVKNNNKGFWLHGSNGPYSATLTVPLAKPPVALADPAPWCAYAMDFPPNATENDGYYDLHGEEPFIVNNTPLAADVKTYNDCITSLTDATASPGMTPPAPTIISTLATPSSIYLGGKSTLIIDANHAACYSFDNGRTWKTTATQVVAPRSTTTYQVKIKTLAGCIASSSITVKVIR